MTICFRDGWEAILFGKLLLAAVSIHKETKNMFFFNFRNKDKIDKNKDKDDLNYTLLNDHQMVKLGK